MDVAPSKKIKAYFLPKDEYVKSVVENSKGYLKTLANVEEIGFINNKSEAGDDSATSVIDGAQIYIPLSDLIDYDKEMERLTKEKEKLEGEIKRADGKLNNKAFVDKAPESVVASEKEKLEKYNDMYSKVIERIEQLQKTENN
jgi:valyl-tRNA synthetase